MENAVIYARYSSHNQTENSIEAQVAAATDYARSHKYNVIHTYADRAKTGTNDNREEFQQMLSATDNKNFTVIIVWKVDRFGRNREEIALNKYRCKKNGVRVEYVAENITDGPEGVILESVLEGFAEYYSRQLSTNVKRGLKNIAKKGGYTGGTCPFGYEIVDGKYVVHEKNAKKIKDVFKLFNSGLNYSEIARKLDLEQYNVRVYLKNPQYYTGTYTRCGVEVENIIPKLITKEEFDQAQVRIQSYTRRKKPRKYLLTGKLHCTCGAKYTGCGFEKYVYYRCFCECGNHRIPKNIIEEDVLSKAYSILKSPESIDSLVDKVYEKLKLKQNILNSPAKKESLVAKKQRLLRLVEDGALPYEDLRERLVQIDAELMKLCSGASIPTIKRSDIKQYIDGLGALSDETALIEAFISNIIVDPKTGNWTIRFGPSHFGTD